MENITFSKSLTGQSWKGFGSFSPVKALASVIGWWRSYGIPEWTLQDTVAPLVEAERFWLIPDSWSWNWQLQDKILIISVGGASVGVRRGIGGPSCWYSLYHGFYGAGDEDLLEFDEVLAGQVAQMFESAAVCSPEGELAPSALSW